MKAAGGFSDLFYSLVLKVTFLNANQVTPSYLQIFQNDHVAFLYLSLNSLIVINYLKSESSTAE